MAFPDLSLGGVNLQTMLQSIAANLPAVVALAIAFSYLAGFWFMFRAIYKLKQYGELRTMMSSNTELKEPILLIITSVVLLFLPTTITILESTFFSNYTPSPISYNTGQASSQWNALANIVYIVIRFFGLIAFIRGCMMIATIGQQGNPHGGTGKAFTHIIGGILLINITATVGVLASLIGVVAS